MSENYTVQCNDLASVLLPHDARIPEDAEFIDELLNVAHACEQPDAAMYVAVNEIVSDLSNMDRHKGERVVVTGWLHDETDECLSAATYTMDYAGPIQQQGEVRLGVYDVPTRVLYAIRIGDALLRAATDA